MDAMRKPFFLLAILTLLAVTATAADVTGKWTAQVPGREGQTREVTFTFKQAGEALTGTMTGRQGDIPITDGKVTGTKLFIANTGDDRVLRLDLGTGTLTVWAESINGADGIAFHDGRLVVAANQADEIVILSDSGRVIAKLGDFLGIGSDGSPRGLLFPASLVIVDDTMFVTNLALPLTGAGNEPEQDVTQYTISRIKIPKQSP